MSSSQHKLCIVLDCTGFQSSRGLCMNHYAKALKAVKRGRFTWQQLEDQGLVLKSNRGNLTGKLWDIKE